MNQKWMKEKWKKTEIHCRYGGRADVLEYLQGKTDDLLWEAI